MKLLRDFIKSILLYVAELHFVINNLIDYFLFLLIYEPLTLQHKHWVDITQANCQILNLPYFHIFWSQDPHVILNKKAKIQLFFR